MSQRKMYEWVARFKSGRTGDEARSGHPPKLHSQGNTNRANTLIREDGRITESEVADMLVFSSVSAYVTVVSISLCG
jgi:hypothetical protein